MWQKLRCYLGWHYKRLYKIVEYTNNYGEDVTTLIYDCRKCCWIGTRKIQSVKYKNLK